MRLASITGSLAIHAALVAVLALAAPRAPVRAARPIAIEVIDAPVREPDHPARATGASGRVDGSGGAGTRPRDGVGAAGHGTGPRAARRRRASPSPWSEVVVHEESGEGEGGDGGGPGRGGGGGFGLGEPGHVPIAAPALPRVPPPPPPSRARPARLLYPTREEPVDDDQLCVAVVTVDEDGDVVGARMVKSLPGSRGELAASMIWRFHYAPALDPDGRPIRATFEQPFGLR